MPDNGWNEWSKHVLKELERLNDNQESLRSKLEEIQADASNILAEIKSTKNNIDELKTWKNRIDDIVSPIQLNDLCNKVDELDRFKIKAITIFAVIQFTIGLIALFI